MHNFAHAALGAALLLLCTAASVSAQEADSSNAFTEAADFVGTSSEEQAIIDGFLAPETPENLFDTASADKRNFGVAPQFNQTGPGALTRLRYTGTGTVGYDEQPIASSGAVSLSCGFGYVDPVFQDAYIGIGSAFYNKGFSCGRCVKLQADDISAKTPGTQAIAQIVDMCGECFDGDMNIAQPLLERLAGRAANPAIAISWDFVDCSPYINTTIKMLVKPGGSAYFQGFNFANSRQVITAAQVNGQRLKHQTNNDWTWSPTGGAINPRGPFNFALLGSNKQVLRVRVGQLRSQDLRVQFAAPVVPGAEPAANATVAPVAEPTETPALPVAAAAASGAAAGAPAVEVEMPVLADTTAVEPAPSAKASAGPPARSP